MFRHRLGLCAHRVHFFRVCLDGPPDKHRRLHRMLVAGAMNATLEDKLITSDMPSHECIMVTAGTFRKASGQRLWQKVPRFFAGPPVYAFGLLYIIYTYFMALSAQSGSCGGD